MAGIYIHIPFCSQRCHYCDFHFSTRLQDKAEMLQALLKEMELQAQSSYLEETIQTVYFGGGTPGLLNGKEIELLLKQLQRFWHISPLAEITLEANPENLSLQNCMDWKTAGINRLSVGIQSIFDDELRWMNRSHDATLAKDSVANMNQAGYENFTVDFIYGGPLLTDERWEQTLTWIFQQPIHHLSCYALTVEPNTPLDNRIRNQRYEPVDPERAARQFERLMDATADNGWEHYEISNWAKNGFRSKHNSNYWNGTPYLGIGPSAHSFNGKSRQWNIADNKKYMQEIQKGMLPFRKEVLTTSQQINESIMTQLRLLEGCNLNKIEISFGGDIKSKILVRAQKHIQHQLLYFENNHLILTRKGKLFADGIAADLFL